MHYAVCIVWLELIATHNAYIGTNFDELWNKILEKIIHFFGNCVKEILEFSGKITFGYKHWLYFGNISYKFRENR